MGRLRDNDVAIDEPVVSRRHAEIVGNDAGFYLRDLGSTNGTFVNKNNIGTEEFLLGDGDEVNLGNGDVSLVFRHFAAATLKPESTEGGGRVSALKRQEGAPVLLG